ncbi:MAG TPA: hypothetical protein VM532_16735 [Burkholderiales bacterium]|nr:hypothetical protein [Burkholderiales bacterium]
MSAALSLLERRWKRIFDVSAVVLVVTLIELVAFSPRGNAAFLCYAAAGVAVVVCIYAAKKLRDAHRVNATADGAWLSQTHAPDD